MNCMFEFYPEGFSAAAWEARPFKRPIYGSDALFTALKMYENRLGFGKYLSGFIYFREGFVSEYNDGTVSGKPYAYVRWWETEMKGCHKGCCKTPPANWDPESRTYALEDWQKGTYVSGAGWLWCACMAAAHPGEPVSSEPCSGHPRSEQVPMKSYWTKPSPAKRSWQEFRRIGGMGGAEDQYKQIKDVAGISKIYLSGIGGFNIAVR